jgi:hypothetical protein
MQFCILKTGTRPQDTQLVPYQRSKTGMILLIMRSIEEGIKLRTMRATEVVDVVVGQATMMADLIIKQRFHSFFFEKLYVK